MGRLQASNLVVVRAGPESLHSGWLDNQCADGWDLIVSHYDRLTYDQRPPDTDRVKHVFFAGGKWEGIHAVFAGSDLLARYEYFWLPDDDIAATPQAIDALFRVAHQRNLAVCQPSLTPDSYYSFYLLIHCPGFRVRYTNLVEIMVPCLHRDVLRIALPLFAKTKSGFGLDLIWHRFAEDNWGRAAVIDEIQVRHTRPVSTISSKSLTNGRSPDEELRELTKVFGLLPRYRLLAYAGITTDGRLVRGKVRLGLRMTLHHVRRARSLFLSVHRREPAWRLLRRQIRNQAHLSQLSVPAE